MKTLIDDLTTQITSDELLKTFIRINFSGSYINITNHSSRVSHTCYTINFDKKVIYTKRGFNKLHDAIVETLNKHDIKFR